MAAILTNPRCFSSSTPFCSTFLCTNNIHTLCDLHKKIEKPKLRNKRWENIANLCVGGHCFLRLGTCRLVEP